MEMAGKVGDPKTLATLLSELERRIEHCFEAAQTYMASDRLLFS